MGWRERRRRRSAYPFFGLTDDYKINLHELIFDLCKIGNLGYDAVYSLPVHYRTFYIRKLIKDQDKDKARYESEKAKAEGKTSSTANIPRGPAIERR